MARLNLRCTACGFHFTATDTQAAKPEGIHCPSCMAPVGINGPPEGGKKEAGSDGIAPKMKIGLGVGAGVLILILIVVIGLYVFGGSPPADEEASTKKRPTPAAEPKKPAAPVEKKATAPKPATPAKPGASTAPSTPESAVPESEPQAAKPSAPATIPALPAGVVAEVRENVLSLKTWHLNLVLTGADRTRVDALLAAGKGTAEDVEFLRGLSNTPAFRVVKEEVGLIRESRERLEKEALDNLPMDKVSMNDGRVLHGRVVEETDAVVRLEKKVSSGSTSVLPLPKADVKAVEKGKGFGSEFKTRWEAGVKDPAALGGLLAWCKENLLTLQASLTAFAILSADPGRADARQQAGLSADPVSRMQEAEKQGGFITFEGRRWVPKELKDKLIRDGNVLVDGHWMKGVPKMFSVPSLFKYENQSEKPVQISGTLAQDESIVFSVAQGDAKFDAKPVRRFYAAADMQVTQDRKTADPTKDADQVIIQDRANPKAGENLHGEVSITVPVPGPILEASVMTSAEVKGGSIVVYLLVDGRREELYKCMGRESSTHKLPDSIKGKTEVQLVAEISGKAAYASKSETKRAKNGKRDTDRAIERGLDITFRQLIPEYSAVLFPSNANTIEVFRLTASIAEPAPVLDKLFANAPGVLQ